MHELGLGERESEKPRLSALDVSSVAACLFGVFLLRVAAATGGTLISLYLASLQQSGVPIKAQVVGLSAMLFYSAELLGSPVFGALSDARGRKPFMLLGPGFGALAIQLIVLAPTIPLVLLARLLQGLSTASSAPSTLSYLSAASGHSERLRGRVMSLFEVATILGLGGGFAIGGFLWDGLGHSGFVAVLGFYAGSALLLWLIRDRRPLVGAARKITGFLAVAKSPPALRLVPAWVAVNAVVGLWLSHVDFQMGKADDPTQLLVGGFSGREIGLYTGGFFLLFVAGIALWSLTFGRLRATQVMAVSLVGLFALVFALYFLNRSQPGDAARILPLVAILSLFLLALSGFTPAALVYLAELTEEFPDGRGSVMGLYSVFLGVGQLLGSGIGGYFADWRGVDGMIVLTGLLGVVAALCVVALARQEQGRAPVRDAGLVRVPPVIH